MNTIALLLTLLLLPTFTIQECAVTLEFSYSFDGIREMRVVTADEEHLNSMGQRVRIYSNTQPRDEGGVLNWTIKNSSGDLRIEYKIISERFELRDFGGTIAEIPEGVRSAHMGQEYVNVSGVSILFIDPLDAEIRDKAEELAGGEESVFLASREIYDWIVENIRYGNRAEAHPKPAAEVLMSRSGDCDEQAALFISMVRSLGIPAFYMDGYVIDGEGVYRMGHAWSAVVMYSQGVERTFPVDTVYREFGIKRANKVFVDVGFWRDHMSNVYNDVRYWYEDGSVPLVEYEVRCTDYVTSSSLRYDAVVDKEYADLLV